MSTMDLYDCLIRNATLLGDAKHVAMYSEHRDTVAGLAEALRAWDRWNYEVQSARANGESVYSHDELQEMRKTADALTQSALAKFGATP